MKLKIGSRVKNVMNNIVRRVAGIYVVDGEEVCLLENIRGDLVDHGKNVFPTNEMSDWRVIGG